MLCLWLECFKKASLAVPEFWLTACSFVCKTWPIMTGSLALKLDSGYCFLLSLSLVSRKISQVSYLQDILTRRVQIDDQLPQLAINCAVDPKTLANDLPSKDSMAGGTLPKSAMNLI